ncbi:MAG: hypothetical protein ABI456_02505 [Ktedonobacteraceae bacterium]
MRDSILVAGDGDVMHKDGKRLQVFVHRASGVTHAVSTALWPTAARRIVATGKMAQWRRYLIGSGKWWMERVDLPSVLFLPALVIVSMFAGGLVVVAMMWRLWYLLLIPAAFLVTLCLLGLTAIMQGARSPTRPPLSAQAIEFHSSLPLRSFPGLSSLRSSPETPMPVASSLVRVLETFDLSHVNVELALGLQSDDTAAAPDFSLNWHSESQEPGGRLPMSRLGETDECAYMEEPTRSLAQDGEEM